MLKGAKWISNGVREYIGVLSEVRANPAPFFRKEFEVDKPVKKAVLFASAKGIYNPYLNGEKASDELFAPSWTNYYKLIQYQEYDVTRLIRQGENCVGAIVSEGWYAGQLAFNKKVYYAGYPLCFIMKLSLEYEDGSSEEIVSDGSFQTDESRVRASEFLDGEYIDNRLTYTEFSLPGFESSRLKSATVESDDLSALTKQTDEPIRYKHILKGEIVCRDKGDIYDFSQNTAGVVKLEVRAKAGAKITVRHAEMLDRTSLYTANLRLARATDTYICKEGYQILMPDFTFHGFRYAEVIIEGEAEVLDAEFCVCHSDLKRAGYFECSSPLINKIYSNTLWSQRSNFIAVPTDCPQRDERLGWTGDAEVFSLTAIYNADCRRFFSKYMRDIRLDQRDNGAVTDVAPYLDITGSGAAAWGDAVTIIPYHYFIMYGDKRIIEDNIEAMKRWVAFMENSSEGLIRPASGYGDWLSIDDTTDLSVLATAYFAWSSLLTAKCLEAIGRDGGYYFELYERVKKAFNDRFVNEKGVIKSDTQCCYLLAIYFGLCDKDISFAHLLRTLERKGYRLSTGFVGVRILLPVLTDMGRADLAYRLIFSEEFPSWGFTVANGATSIWERWNSYTPETGFGDVGMNSFNHYSLGSCVEWLYTHVLGIKTSIKTAGFSAMTIAPKVDPEGRLSFAKGSYESVRGKVEVEWHEEGDGMIRLTVLNPAAIPAEYIIDGDIAQIIQDGEVRGEFKSDARETTVRYYKSKQN